MKHIYARQRKTAKRKGGSRITLVDDLQVAQPITVSVLDIYESLKELASRNPRLAQVVELRFFGGLTEDEIAAVLEVSSITVKRDWRIARAVLYSCLLIRLMRRLTARSR